jgi:hypothetical protein
MSWPARIEVLVGDQEQKAALLEIVAPRRQLLHERPGFASARILEPRPHPYTHIHFDGDLVVSLENPEGA